MYHLYIQKPIKDGILTVKQKLKEDLSEVNCLPEERKKIILKYLDTLPDGDVLCHFDFHPGNVMIDGENAFFLDWMTACKGDACADVMRTCILLKYGEYSHMPWLSRKIASLLMHYICHVYVKKYLKITKKDINSIKQWELPVAAARLHEWISDNEKEKLMRLVDEKCRIIESTFNNR